MHLSFCVTRSHLVESNCEVADANVVKHNGLEPSEIGIQGYRDIGVAREHSTINGWGFALWSFDDLSNYLIVRLINQSKINWFIPFSLGRA